MTHVRNPVRSLASLRFEITAVHVAFSAVLLLAATSAFALSLGEPELVVPVAALGVVVTLVALAVLSARTADADAGRRANA
jgi:hypothetical protein